MEIQNSQPLTIISLCVIAALSIGNVVNADECRQSCGIVYPITVFQPNLRCESLGDDSVSYQFTVNWDDGTYTEVNATNVVRLDVGSCCSDIRIEYYGTGVVASGRFSGENVAIVYNYRDDRQTTCNGCQSSAGLTRASIEVLITFGTKGVGNWIECTGNGYALFSPAMTASPRNIYRTFGAVFDKCSDCVESC